MIKSNYILHQDPEGTLLQVPLKEIINLGINSKISDQSYFLNEYAYLNDQNDISHFILSLFNLPDTIDNCKPDELETLHNYWKTIPIKEHTSNPIRNYPPYLSLFFEHLSPETLVASI